jgi:hypothetical protein
VTDSVYGQTSFSASLNSNFPTRFAKPFRSFAGAAFNFISASSTISSSLEVEAGVLRGDPTSFTANTPTRPLFQIDTVGTGTTTAAAGIWAPHNPDRNPLFRYQGIERLANLVTTRSNVYAVWITVGYFQVTPNQGTGAVDAGHPDGYQLEAELGSDTGEIERHRAFYIFDRTIPVGFLRGQDTNIEKGVLLRRYIE